MPTSLRFPCSKSTEIPVVAFIHINIILQTGNDRQTLSWLMTTYMYTIHKQYRSESDSSHRNDLLKSDHDSLLVDILAIVCRANYIISQKNGYDLPS